MDKEALERGLARRLFDHIENRTTDLADGVLEVPTDVYLGAHHDREVSVLFHGRPRTVDRKGPWDGLFYPRCWRYGPRGRRCYRHR